MSSPPTPPTPIGSLLRVKQAAEDAAARRLQAATTRRAAAEASQRALDDRVGAARADLRARRAAAGVGVLLAASGDARERFWVDLRKQIAARAAEADAHRQGPLADALAEAGFATTAHLAARAAREQIEKLCEKADTARRAITARREEIALDEQSQATRKI